MRRGIIIYILILLFTCCYMIASAQELHVLNTRYTPSIANGTVKKYLQDIEHVTKVRLSYSASYIDLRKKVSLDKTETTLQDALQKILDGQQLLLKESGDKILIVAAEDNKPAAPSKITINGYVKEAINKEVLIGAVVYVPVLGIGTTTNSYGYYSLTMPAGAHKVLCSYIGYVTDSFSFADDKDVRKDILLTSQAKLEEVNITDDKTSTPDHHHLVYADIRNRPAILGENDVMRALQYVAGVQSGTDGTNAVMVRGGDPGQNLNLLDGVPLYYIDHFFGLTSVYNSEAIKSVDFHKGAFPARYGGRLSSVIDVNTKDGDMEHLGGQFTMGLVKGSLNLEGPIIKDKASVMISARRTWFDLLWRPFTNALKINFYDVNGKANYILNKNNRLYLSIYNGRDGMGVDFSSQGTKAKWGNTVASARWNSILNPKLFLNTTFTYSNFKFYLSDKQQLIEQNAVSNANGYEGNSSIKDLALRSKVNWYLSTSQKLELGIGYSRAYFTPVQVLAGSKSITSTDKFHSNELVLFAEDEIKILDRWTVRPGLHVANWFSDRFNYSSLQPRLYTAYKLSMNHSVYASYTQMGQFVHLISNNTYGLPADFWLPSSSKIRPELSKLVTLGYGKTGKAFSYNIEGYYKDLENTVAYNMGKNLFDNSLNWDEKIIQGKGWSYGGEVSGKIKFKPFVFSVAYTLSWTWRQFAQLNDGQPFPYRYDRRHNLRSVLLYQPSPKFDAAVSWSYMSGEAITMPDQIYPDFDNNLLIFQSAMTNSSNYTYNYVSWNNYRLPAIHRLDFGVNFIKKRKVTERTWSCGIFNAYGRKNVVYVELVNADANGGAGNFKLKGVSILQFIPYISYKLSF
ncbi:MAG: TonB-dependent receptor [Bacteroidetes bacterium]|nr:TonB-dependent receptor [Bacteroidota bacterium]